MPSFCISLAMLLRPRRGAVSRRYGRNVSAVRFRNELCGGGGVAAHVYMYVFMLGEELAALVNGLLVRVNFAISSSFAPGLASSRCATLMRVLRTI